MVANKGFIFVLLLLNIGIYGSEVADYDYPAKNKNVVFFLSTPKSGSNVMTGCLLAMTRKPISWFYWGKEILNPSCEYRKHISYNRLELPLVSDRPLLYRTHYQFNELLKVPSKVNKLIFVTRNPKELIYRKFFLTNPQTENPDSDFIEDYLRYYLNAFEVYDGWYSKNRKLVYYEEFIVNDDEILLQLLDFMNEQPVFLDDYIVNKQEYLSRLLQSYSNQHKHNSGGSSSKDGPKAIYYTRNASKETLKFIDSYIMSKAPQIWYNYLNRYATTD